MTRRKLILVLGILLAASTLSVGETVVSKVHFGDKALQLGGYAAWQAVENVKANQHSRVIVSGDGSTYLGVYVYDRHGNCVAWDDAVTSGCRDDLVTQWTAPAAGAYTVEVKNLAAAKNKVEFAVQTVTAEGPGDRPGKRNETEGQEVAFKGAEGAAIRRIIDARSQVTFRKTFTGGTRASVTVVGDHDPPGRLDVEVFDEQGNFVARDSCSPDFVSVIWYPPRDAEYTITVRNHAQVHNKCTVAVR